MAILPATNKQLPDHAILDHFDKQCYLGNTYSATVPFTATLTETPVLLLANNQVFHPTASSSIATALFQNFLKLVENTAGDSAILKVYANPTITAVGAPVIPINMRLAYANSSIATITSGPTASANGTLIDAVSALALTEGFSNILKIIDPGNSILITATASAAATILNVICQWYEI